MDNSAGTMVRAGLGESMAVDTVRYDPEPMPDLGDAEPVGIAIDIPDVEAGLGDAVPESH